jgi:hypothetical protein
MKTREELDVSEIIPTENYILVLEEYARYDYDVVLRVGTGKELLDFLKERFFDEDEELDIESLESLMDDDGGDSYRIYKI